jgi:hypothetical protein
MTLHIELAPELEARLRERAAAAGVDVETFAREAVEEKLRGRKGLDAVLGPVRQEFHEISDEELDERIQRAISEVRGNAGEV